MLGFIRRRHNRMDTRKWGAKTVNFLGGRKFEICFYANCLYLNEPKKECRFDKLSWESAGVFVRYKPTKELSLKVRAYQNQNFEKCYFRNPYLKSFTVIYSFPRFL